jgi:hypothetical protein
MGAADSAGGLVGGAEESDVTLPDFASGGRAATAAGGWRFETGEGPAAESTIGDCGSGFTAVCSVGAGTGDGWAGLVSSRGAASCGAAGSGLAVATVAAAADSAAAFLALSASDFLSRAAISSTERFLFGGVAASG